MSEVLSKRILKLICGPIDIARGPFFLAFVPKNPGIEFLKFNHEDSGISDKDDIYLSGAAFIRNDNVSEFEEIETPWDCLKRICWFKEIAR